MNKKLYTILIWTLSVLFVSCSDFLVEVSQDQIIPHTAQDYKEFIAGEIYSRMNNYQVATYLDAMTDDCEEFVVKPINEYYANDARNTGFGYFTWQSVPEFKITGSLNNDVAWESFYHHILISNIVLKDINTAQGTEEELNQVKGEALSARAFAYWMLVNLYGEPYNPQSADQDMGVPINNLVGAQDIKFKRASVKEIYDIIIGDLNQALQCFGKSGDNESRFCWNKYAAELFLSRVYLFVEDWASAEQHADNVIREKGTLWNLNDKNSGAEKDQCFFTLNNPEILFSYGYYMVDYLDPGVNCGYPASASLKSLFQKGDLRYGQYDGAYVRNQYSYMGGGPRYTQYKNGYSNVTLVHGRAFRTAEAYLIKAEALANMKDRYLEALEVLDLLRSYRFVPSDYQKLSVSTQAEMLQKVMDERRMEMCFEQLRWFDLRRWKNARKEIVHWHTPNIDKPEIKEYYILEKNDPAYTLSIPQAVLERDTDLVDYVRPNRKSHNENPSK